MIIITILLMVLFFKVMGLMFRMSWGITKGILKFVGFLFIAGLVISFAGVFLLPAIVVIALAVLLTKSLKEKGDN